MTYISGAGREVPRFFIFQVTNLIFRSLPYHCEKRKDFSNYLESRCDMAIFGPLFQGESLPRKAIFPYISFYIILCTTSSN